MADLLLVMSNFFFWLDSKIEIGNLGKIGLNVVREGALRACLFGG